MFELAGVAGRGGWGCTSCGLETLTLRVNGSRTLGAEANHSLAVSFRNPRAAEWLLPQVEERRGLRALRRRPAGVPSVCS